MKAEAMPLLVKVLRRRPQKVDVVLDQAKLLSVHVDVVLAAVVDVKRDLAEVGDVYPTVERLAVAVMARLHMRLAIVFHQHPALVPKLRGNVRVLDAVVQLVPVSGAKVRRRVELGFEVAEH